jgi:hypothetical protein
MCHHIVINFTVRVSELIETLACYEKEGKPDTKEPFEAATPAYVVVDKPPLDTDSGILLGRL